MTSFWVNLQQLAKGQLFNGGYLDARTLQSTNAPAAPRRSITDALRDTPARCLPHTQIVGCR